MKVVCLMFCATMLPICGGEAWAVRRLVAMEYPPLPQAARVQGVVKLQCSLEDDGSVHDCIAVSGHPLFDKATIQNAKKWSFRKVSEERTSEQTVELEYHFRLEGEPIRGRPSTLFSFEFPNRIEVTSPSPCINHLPCTPEEMELLQKQSKKRTKP